MRKLLITLSLIFVSLASLSQAKLIATKAFLGHWNDYSKEYQIDDNDIRDVRIRFSFYDTYIQVEDEARSLYRIVKTYPRKTTQFGESITADCLDERNIKCIVSLITYKDTSELHIVVQYAKVAYFYIVTKDK